MPVTLRRFGILFAGGPQTEQLMADYAPVVGLELVRKFLYKGVARVFLRMVECGRAGGLVSAIAILCSVGLVRGAASGFFRQEACDHCHPGDGTADLTHPSDASAETAAQF